MPGQPADEPLTVSITVTDPVKMTVDIEGPDASAFTAGIVQEELQIRKGAIVPTINPTKRSYHATDDKYGLLDNPSRLHRALAAGTGSFQRDAGRALVVANVGFQNGAGRATDTLDWSFRSIHG